MKTVPPSAATFSAFVISSPIHGNRPAPSDRRSLYGNVSTKKASAPSPVHRLFSRLPKPDRHH